VFWAAFFNFVAFAVFGLHVANTIGTGIIEPHIIDERVIFGALTGAIVWNLITWGLGIPSSSSHALIGGLVGAGMAKGGLAAAVWGGLTKTLVAIVLSPLVGFLLALALVAIVSWLSMRSTPFTVDRERRRAHRQPGDDGDQRQRQQETDQRRQHDRDQCLGQAAPHRGGEAALGHPGAHQPADQRVRTAGGNAEP